MHPFLVIIKINPSLYSKDPQSSKLGQKIIEYSVLLIDEIGLDHFTFKKLAKKINSAEASIYRYFENKHQLFVYLLNWYWEWMIIRIELNTLNLNSSAEKLKVALDVIVDTAQKNTAVEFVDEEILHRIVVTEGSKGYRHKYVDDENKEGYFLAYKRLCKKISDIILENNPDFQYPRALASMLIESANNNIYFAKHLPRLTDIKNKSESELSNEIKNLINFFAYGIIHSDMLIKHQHSDVKSS